MKDDEIHKGTSIIFSHIDSFIACNSQLTNDITF